MKYLPAGRVLERFRASDKFVRGIRGPIGSGKSTACVVEILRRAQLQKPGPDGKRRTRWGVIRNCYDDQTEILTEQRGWQFFASLTPTDKVATLQDERVVYVKPDGVSISDYEGEMIGFEGEGVDFLVTPDHEMWVSKKRGRSQTYGQFEMKYAQEIFGTASYRVRKDAIWNGSIDLTDAECELIGYWYAEGSRGTYGGRDRIVITSVNDVEYARDLLLRAGVGFVEWKRDKGVNFVFKGENRIAGYLAGSSSTKRVPSEIKSASPGQIAAFIEGYFAGDGHQRKDAVTRTIYTSSKGMADDLQELAMKAGGAANVASRDRRGSRVAVGDAVGVVNHVEYTVTLLGKTKLRPKLVKQVGRYRGWYKQPYKGKVYCAEMDIPVVFVRRNGKAFWCRRTYPELKTTTIKTWHAWVPPEFGEWQAEGPPTHRLNMGDLECEVMFLALDRPDDIRKLLSLELTGAWINEAREVPKAVLDGLTGRVGRYPSALQGGASWFGVMMDTNPPDSDHWWYRLAEETKPEGFEFFAQPAGDGPDAENLPNLPAGYYERTKAGKDPDWIKVYVRGDYGFVRDGKPVWSDYRDNVHCRDVAPNPGLPIRVGLDFGLTPAAVFTQRGLTGQWRVLAELVATDMGAKRFGEMLGAEMRGRWAGYEFLTTGDPAGDSRAQTDETTPFQILRALGVDAKPAPSNDPVLRIEAVGDALRRMIDGEPGFIIDPSCRQLRKAMAGGYCYRRVQVAGSERYQDKPDKTMYSHVADALQYALIGGGEGRALVRRPAWEIAPPVQTVSDYSPFDW